MKLQITFMRRCAGVARPAHRLLFAELGQLPMHYHVFKTIIGFYSRIQKQRHSLCYKALRDELIEAIQARGNGPADLRTLDRWGRAFLHLIEILADVWAGSPADLHRRTAAERADFLLSRPLPEAALLGAFRARLMSGWEHARLATAPDAFPSDGIQPGIQMAKYKHWMGLGFQGHAPTMSPAHMHATIPYESHRMLMRFRLCQWPLAANRLHHLGREHRKCCLCNGAVEDERHVLVSCSGYADIRAKYGLGSSTDMQAIMRCGDQVKIANCLREIWARRTTQMAEVGTASATRDQDDDTSRDDGPLRLA